MPSDKTPNMLTFAEVAPYLMAIVDRSQNEQAAMREFGVFLLAAVSGGRVSQSDSRWQPVFELVADFSLYEPNPQFCNHGAGIYDYGGLQKSVSDVLEHVRRDGV